MKAPRKHRATGGVNAAAEDLKTKNQRYTYQSKVNEEAEERKRGGKTMPRKARKSGGRAGSNNNPLSSAAAGTPPKGRTMQMN